MSTTKAPWKVFEILTDNGWWFKVSSSQTDSASGGESICNITTRDLERAEANANLVASAPQLLNELIRAKQALLDNGYTINSSLIQSIDNILNPLTNE